jgi:hypothetical protein
MKQRLIIWCLVLVVPASLLANRFIVNTGPGPEDLPGFSLGGLQWVAVEFDVTTSATITRVDGWMIVSREGFLDLSLYRDGGEVPGELLFRSTGFVNSGNAEWRGLSSLNWTVTPGTYSIGFERREGGMSGALPFPGKRPLWNGAVVDLESDLTYIEADRSQHSACRHRQLLQPPMQFADRNRDRTGDVACSVLTCLAGSRAPARSPDSTVRSPCARRSSISSQ